MISSKKLEGDSALSFLTQNNSLYDAKLQSIRIDYAESIVAELCFSNRPDATFEQTLMFLEPVTYFQITGERDGPDYVATYKLHRTVGGQVYLSLDPFDESQLACEEDLDVFLSDQIRVILSSS